MTIDELYQAARLRVRKTAQDGLDDDIKRIVQTAITDLNRIGVHSSWLDNPSDPLIVDAILSYVKANYSIDANAYPVLAGIYDMNITKVKGDGKYFSVAPEPIPEPDTDPNTEPSNEPNNDPNTEPNNDPDPNDPQTGGAS